MFKLPLNVYLFSSWDTVTAQRAISIYDRFACETRFFIDSKFTHASIHCYLWHIDSSSVFTNKKNVLWVLKDGLEYSDKRLLYLMLKIVIIVDRKIIFEYIQGIFGFLIAFGIFCCFDHHIRNSVAHSRSSGLISFSHLFCQFNMCLFYLISICIAFRLFLGFFSRFRYFLSFLTKTLQIIRNIKYLPS